MCDVSGVHIIIKLWFSLIDRRGIVVTEDAERVTVATAVPAATATEAVANEAFANSTVAVVDQSDNERFASSDKVCAVVVIGYHSALKR